MKPAIAQVGDLVDHYASFRQRPLTLRQIYTHGASQSVQTRIETAVFLRQELPVRLAHMVREIERLPFGLNDTSACRAIHELYIRSLLDILNFDRPESEADEERFTELLTDIKNRHRNVVSTMALGVQELKQRSGAETIAPAISNFLDHFYTSRIGIRMLIGQFIALRESDESWVGIINGRTAPAQVTRDAARRAEELCRMNYGEAPKLEIRGRTDLRFTYIPSHLMHMLFELLKNSYRATAEAHQGSRDLPPVRVVIADGQEDVAIKVEDEGGGIPRSGMDRIWTYLYTTASPRLRKTADRAWTSIPWRVTAMACPSRASMRGTSAATCS